MKKYILIMDAIKLLERLVNGKRVEGVLYMDENTGKLTFKAYNRQRRARSENSLICHLEHGWLKESKERIKLYLSVPKVLGGAHVSAILGRDTQVANDALIDRELDMIEFC